MKTPKFIAFIFCLFSLFSYAHPSPDSKLLLDIYQNAISGELHLPVDELKLVTGNNYNNFNTADKAMLEEYIYHHFKIRKDNKLWKLRINAISLNSDVAGNSKNKEVIMFFDVTPYPGAGIRDFYIYYDAILHKVQNHKVLVSIRQDWSNGQTHESDELIGSIFINTNTLNIEPFHVSLKKGNNWKGFTAMVKLGMRHISEGTDHLMFLLLLLFTAPLISVKRHWRVSDSFRRALSKIFRITISFTIGHSITLVLASLGVISFSSPVIEALIAFSILITAVHLIKPIFPNRENLIAIGFGLIHGLAFSTILADLHLASSQLVLSLLGFNIGIELMQIFIIVLVMPWLLFIARYVLYKYLKNIIAGISIVASIGWIVQRLTGNENIITKCLNLFTPHSILFVVFLFLFSLICYFTKKKL